MEIVNFENNDGNKSVKSFCPEKQDKIKTTVKTN